MSVRLAIVVAVILVGTGVGIVYLATLIAAIIPPDVSRSLSSAVWYFLTLIGFGMIIVGLLTFYGTYLTNRFEAKRRRTDQD